MQSGVAALIAELDAALFVIDCVPNMDAQMVARRTQPFIRTIRQQRPETPILLVEDRTFADAHLIPAKRAGHAKTRRALREAYDALVAAGDKHLAYLPGDALLGADGEGTVDGSHPTDLGFVREADVFQPVIGRLLTDR